MVGWMFFLEPTVGASLGWIACAKKNWSLLSWIHVHSICSCASSRFFCFNSIHFFRKIPGFLQKLKPQNPNQCGWFQNPWNSGPNYSQKTNSFDKQSPCSIHKSMTPNDFCRVYPHFLVVKPIVFCHVKTVVFLPCYPLVNCPITMENHHV